MENRLKIRVSRMFRSSFGSCRTQNFSDVMEKAVFTPHYHPSSSSHLIEPMSPRLRPFPSIFRPKSSETSESLQVLCFDSFCDDFINGTSCLPASRSCENESGFSQKVKESARKKKDTKKRWKTTMKKKKNTQMKINHKETKDGDDFRGNWWYSSDDDEDKDDETETLFSSKSSSSDSSRSRSFRRRHHSRRRKQEYGSRVSSKKGNYSEKGTVLPLPAKAKVKDSFAVVKRSSDPYGDFRTSMVEMIVEKQIFAPRDLENLLECFLSLNSHHHHKIIVEVFTEVYDALFL